MMVANLKTGFRTQAFCQPIKVAVQEINHFTAPGADNMTVMFRWTGDITVGIITGMQEADQSHFLKDI